ncbi:MAG: hypothetical protein BWK80_04540 [Desulfobacteraceae bacterium IS3]|nr:MAG: hypothetical protein BWK80_04540 [Desulfobacteraceae bacterium IS3]
MTWWQTLIVALSTLIVTKGVDFTIKIVSEGREFKKYRREKIFAEVEELKSEIGILLELSANWKAVGEKKQSYQDIFSKDHELIGKINKYPVIAGTARDALHCCKIVAQCEMDSSDDLVKYKKELHEKYKLFVEACENHINSMI